MSWRRIVTAGGLLVAAGLLFAAPALASFHHIKVREVYPGAGAEDAYVELQMYEAGQNLVGGRSLTVYDSAGALVHTSTVAANVAKGENQRTVLIGDSSVEAVVGVKPDFVDSGLSISAAGGAVCWIAGEPTADCVAWGNFAGAAALRAAGGTPVGTPVLPGGIPARTALRRSIAPGCATLLEAADDTDNSSVDFEGQIPAPRNNATAPTEHACLGVPNTTLGEHPPSVSNVSSAAFTFSSSTATGFECSLDAAPFAACPGANAGEAGYADLADGPHAFKVRAVNAEGPDPTPAAFNWTIDTVAPTSTIDTHPADPSPGASAAFTFHASEQVSKFECSLSAAGQPDAFALCLSGKTYLNLTDGTYTFELRATDQAGNLQAIPTQFTWRVDNTVADTTPPETTIVSRPPDPSTSPNAAFTYGSKEPGSTFECSLDGAPFASCPSTGIAYADLPNGPHTFRVRATDPAGNVDPSPAAYTFSVAVLSPPPIEGGPIPAPPLAHPPRTVVTSRPPTRTPDRTPTFRFRATAGTTYQCSVDRGRFKPCRSPFTTPRLTLGRHTVGVRALADGIVDPTPARLIFEVIGKG